jgi:hypothetical protein
MQTALDQEFPADWLPDRLPVSSLIRNRLPASSGLPFNLGTNEVKNPIFLIFDFSSPCGYLSNLRMGAIAAQHGRSVAWKPILHGAIFKASENALGAAVAQR